MEDNNLQPLKDQIQQLQNDLAALTEEMYHNNFSNSQDFQKYSRFNTRLKVPHNASLPTTCEVGEICEVIGKLYVCSASNVWTIVGTQT